MGRPELARECADLRVRSLDTLRASLNVTESLGEVRGCIVVGPPKSAASWRTMDVPAPLMEVLSAELARRGIDDANTGGFVFAAAEGGPLRYGAFRSRVWLPATAKCGLEGLSFHDLRRAEATAMVALGVEVRSAQARLGHEHRATTQADALHTTATVPPSSTPTNPEYCYVVTSVGPNATGTTQESSPSNLVGPTAASAASTTVVPAFTGGDAGLTVVDAFYNQAINPLTVALNGSDYTVTATNTTTGVTTAQTVSAAAPLGTSAVSLTLAAPLTSGETVVVTAKTGTDGNTVCAGTATTSCQAVGNAFQTTSGTVAPLNALVVTANPTTVVASGATAGTSAISAAVTNNGASVGSGAFVAFSVTGTGCSVSPASATTGTTGTAGTTLTVAAGTPAGSCVVTATGNGATGAATVPHT